MVKKLVCFLILTSFASYAKDLGVYGHIYDVTEVSPIKMIQEKLDRLKANGSILKHNQIIKNKIKHKILNPQRLKGVTTAKKNNSFFYDPTYVVADDIFDHNHKLIARRNDKINPLETVSLSENLLFIDAEDKKQVQWIMQEKGKIILIAGNPTELSKKITRPVYFDQASIITKKIGIKHVPSRVTQSSLLLKIDEIFLEEE